MILITGATGFVGRALVERLAKDGYRVRVLLPTSQQDDLWPTLAVDKIYGSIFNVEVLHQALIGVHTVFHLASAQWWGHKRDLEEIDLNGTQSIITAARAARVGRLIVLSHLGAAPSSAYMLLRAKGQVEETVRSSGLAHTIFRSGIIFGPHDHFVNNVAQLLRLNPVLFLQPGHGEGLLHPLYIDDLIAAMVASMEHLDTVDQTIEIGGPEYVTFNELVRTVMRVTNAPRLIVPVPPYIMRTLVSMSNVLFPYWPMTTQWFDILASNRTTSMGALYNLFGIRPARFEDTIATYMPQRHWGRTLLSNLLRRQRRSN